MRHTFALAGALVAMICIPAARTLPAPQVVPRLTFDYGDVFDITCYDAIKKPLNAALAQEAQQKVDASQHQWDNDGPAVLETVVKVTGVPFAFDEAQGALVTCPAFSSNHLPLMFNVGGFLEASGRDRLVPMKGFTHIVAHELLHRYVDDRLSRMPGGTTPLLSKYASEPRVVRHHLHVLAILEVVFQTLGRDDDVRATRATGVGSAAIAGLRGPNDMARAHQIIAVEHASTFVNELAVHSSNQ